MTHRHPSRQHEMYRFGADAVRGAAAAACLLAAAGSSLGADHTWIGTSTNGNWGDPFHWEAFNFGPPTENDSTVVHLEGSDTSPDIQDIFDSDVDYHIDSLVLEAGYSGSGSLVLTGGQLTVDHAISNKDEENLIIGTNVVAGDADISLAALFGGISLNLPLDLSTNNSLIDVSGTFGGYVVLSGGISDTQSVVSAATLDVDDGIEVTIGGASHELTQVIIRHGSVAIDSVGLVAEDLNVDVQSAGDFVIGDFDVDIDQLTGAGEVFLGGGSLTVGSDSDFTLSGFIGGDGGSLIKDKSGVMIYSRTASHTGATSVTAGTLRLTSSGRLSGESDVNVVFGATLDLNGSTDRTFDSIAGSGTILLGSGNLTVDEDGGTRTFFGNIEESGELTKKGDHTLVLAGTNTFALLDIDAGTLEVASGASLGSGSIELGAGTLQVTNTMTNPRNVTLDDSAAEIRVDSAATLTQSGSVDGSGSLTKTGDGVLALTGVNTYAGTTTLAAGVVSVAGDGNLGMGDLAFDGGTLEVTGSFTNGRSVSITSGTTAVFDISSATLEQAASINGDATTAMLIQGGGTLRTTVAQGGTFDGDIVVVEGTFDMAGGGNGLGNSTTVTVDPLGTFLVNNAENIGGLDGSGSVVLNENLSVGFDDVPRTFAGAISGSGDFGKDGTSTLTLTGSNTYSGLTRVLGGTIRLDGAGRLSNDTDVEVEAGASFDVNGVTDTVNSISGAGTIRLGDGNLRVNATSGTHHFSGDVLETGELTKNGDHTLVLSGTNFFSLLDINAGVLEVSSPSNLGFGQIELGAAEFRVTNTMGNFVPIALDNGLAAINVAAASTLSQTAEVGGSGALMKLGDGTLVLVDSNTYTGPTTVSAGTLLANNSAGSATGNGDVTIENGATLGGTGSIAGTVQVHSGGTVAPGKSPGILDVDDIVFDAGSTLHIEVGGLLPGDQYDVLSVADTAEVAGTLIIDLVDLGGGVFEPSLGDSFDIVVAGAISGAFDTVSGGGVVTSDVFLGPVYDATTIRLVAQLPGDGNGDGWVDGLDYLLWAGNFGTHPGIDGSADDGDYNDDGWVDGLDYLLWAGNFGSHVATAVPEPSGAALVVVGLLWCVALRRR